MDASRLSILDLTERRLTYLDRRQEVLAQNIANADSPGYAARDLVPFAELLARGRDRSLAGLRPVQTNRGHLPGTRIAAAAVAQDRRVAERPISGNGVVLDEQLMKVAATDTQQQLALGIYRKYLGLFRTALGRIA